MPLLGALLSCGVPDAGLFRSHDCTSLESPWAPGGPARIAHWAELGVSALDGETSALFVLASILGMHAASLAYLAENYATGAAAPMDAQARGAAVHGCGGGTAMLLIRGAMLPDFETGTTTQADVLIRDGPLCGDRTPSGGRLPHCRGIWSSDAARHG